MLPRIAETSLLRLAKTATAAAGMWQLGDGNRGASRAGLHAIRAVDGKEVPDGRGAQDGFGGLLPPVRVGSLVLARVKQDTTPSRKEIVSRIEVGLVLVLAVG